MGMYTELRFEAIIKPEYVEMIRDHVEELNWEETYAKYPEMKFLENFIKIDRADWIPGGGAMFSEDLRSLTFEIEVKNHDSVVDVFISEVAQEIVEKVIVLEKEYETWDWYIEYDFNKEGKLVEKEKVNKYGDEPTGFWGLLE